jgi:hypothetical protein
VRRQRRRLPVDSALVWHVAVVAAIYRDKNMAQRNGMSMLQDHIMKI